MTAEDSVTHLCGAAAR